MKLKAKIQLLICVAQVVIILLMGAGIGYASKDAINDMVEKSVASGATLASEHIAQQLQDYMDAATIAGKSNKLNSDATAEDKMDYMSAYTDVFGFVSVNILDTKGISINDGTDFSDRDYVQKALKGEANVSDVTLSKYTNTYGVSIAAPIQDKNNNINGVVYFRMDIDFILKVIENIDFSENSYAYLIDNTGLIIAHPNQELILNSDPEGQPEQLRNLLQKMISGEVTSGEYTYNGKTVYCGSKAIANTNDWSVIIASPQTDYKKSIQIIQFWILGLGALSLVMVFILTSMIASVICKPIEIVKDALVAVSKGDFSTKLEESTGKDEIAVLMNTTSELVNTLSKILGEANEVLGKIANSDLTGTSMGHYPGEFDSLANSVNTIKLTLTRLIVEVQNAVLGVDTGSKELAEATAALSQGTVQQASSIQMLADNLNTIVEKINRNSENEAMVNDKLADLDKEIQSANVQMQKLLEAVDEIETMSSSIQKIVSTIDGIAFQTNILSLNASVEAARAGDLGNGFAVVAEEVRALAEKCSESSRKTSELITKCINSINNAKKCADATFENLSDIVGQSSEIAGAFDMIAQDTSEQAEKSKNIQVEVNNISDVVQTNTATVEETAASTAVLSEQASNLEEMIKHFKVK